MKYTPDQTKQHFAEICQCIWNKILAEQPLAKKTAQGMRQFVANFTMLAWNMSLTSPTLKATQAELLKFAKQMYDGEPCAVNTLNDASELKWREYKDDTNFVAQAEVIHENGNPRVIVTLKGENPEIVTAFEKVKSFMSQDEIDKQLENVPPERVAEELQKVLKGCIAKYNASLPSSPSKTKSKQPKSQNVYIFRVSLDVDEDIYRDIAILGTQTFEDLHEIIFEAFDRFDPHLYYFHYEGRRIWAHEYEPDNTDLDASKTKIKDMKLKQGIFFGYTFDLGDEWDHSIELLAICPLEHDIDYPVIIDGQGESPDQYGNNEEPDMVFHPLMLEMLSKQRPQWDCDEDFLFVDECDNCPAPEDIDSFVREDICVSNRDKDVVIHIEKLSDLFRDSDVDEDTALRLFIATIRNVILSLAEDGLIVDVSNAEFLKIFSGISREPDKLSKSFLYNMIWKTSVIFLLQYECDATTFKKLLQLLGKTIKANKTLSFFEFCQLDLDEDDEDYE